MLLIHCELFYIVKYKGILNHNTFPLLKVSESCSSHTILAVSYGTQIQQIYDNKPLNHQFAQSAGAVEYTDCTSAEG